MSKPVRGRFLIVVPLEGGGSWKCESSLGKYMTASEIARCLRQYADYIDEYFLPQSATEADAVAKAAE